MLYQVHSAKLHILIILLTEYMVYVHLHQYLATNLEKEQNIAKIIYGTKIIQKKN